jgi:hypothetical protein
MQDKEEIEIVDVHIITPVNLAALKKTAEAGDRGCQTALKLADEFIEFMGGSERYCMAGCSNDVAFNIDNGNTSCDCSCARKRRRESSRSLLRLRPRARLHGCDQRTAGKDRNQSRDGPMTRREQVQGA